MLNSPKVVGISVLLAGGAVVVIAAPLLSVVSGTAIASDVTSESAVPASRRDTANTTVLAQVNMIDPTPPLGDVPVDHWGYTAVQRLVENYGCIVGYPDGTFQGNEPLTRYEFAAGLAACLDASLENTRPPVSEVQEIQQDLQRQLECLTGDIERLEGNETDAGSCAEF